MSDVAVDHKVVLVELQRVASEIPARRAATVRELQAEGMTLQQIGNLVGVSRQAVKNWITRA